MADAIEQGDLNRAPALDAQSPGAEAPGEAAPETKAQGRKAGARKPAAGASSATIRVKQHPPKPRDPERLAAARQRKEVRDSSARSATALLEILNGSVAMTLGDTCVMPEPIRQGIEKPLQRTIERIDPETNEAVSKYADPILVAFYMVGWLVFIWRVTSQGDEGDQGPGHDEGPPTEPTPPDDIKLPSDVLESDNGREREEITRVPDPAEIRAQLGGVGSLIT